MDIFKDNFTYENGLTVTGLTKELNIFYILQTYQKLKKIF